MHTNNRIFDVCTNISSVFIVSFHGRNHHVLLTKMVIDDDIPHTDLREYIIVVCLTVISESKSKFNELQLIVKLLD